MADSFHSGSVITRVTGSFPFANIHFVARTLTGSVSTSATVTGSFPLTGTMNFLDTFGVHMVDSYTSGVVEQLTIVGHTAGEPFYVERHILVSSGILS